MTDDVVGLSERLTAVESVVDRLVEVAETGITKAELAETEKSLTTVVGQLRDETVGWRDAVTAEGNRLTTLEEKATGREAVIELVGSLDRRVHAVETAVGELAKRHQEALDESGEVITALQNRVMSLEAKTRSL